MPDAGSARVSTEDMPAELPRYGDLPAAGHGGRSGWGLFGPADSVALLNLQTNATVLAAAGLVRKGAVFPLNAELDAVNPPLDEDRAMVRHRVLHQPGPGFPDLDDVLDNFFPQISSQWDSLAHVAYTPGVFYNGATDDDVLIRKRNTIDHWVGEESSAAAFCWTLTGHLPRREGPILRRGRRHSARLTLKTREHVPESIIRPAALC